MGRVRAWVVAFVASALSLPTFEEAFAAEALWHRTPPFAIQGSATDPDGNVYVAGYAPRGEPSCFGKRFVLVIWKLASDGAVRWKETWRSRDPLCPHAMAFNVTVSLDDRDVYVVGGVFIDSAEAARARIWALTRTGRSRWSRGTAGVGGVGYWRALAAGSNGPSRRRDRSPRGREPESSGGCVPSCP